MKNTLSYIIEIIHLFEEVCLCEQNDFGKLLELKKSYFDYSERVRKYHLFSNELNKDEISFLKNRKIKNFQEELNSLHLLIKKHFTFEIMPPVISYPFHTIEYFMTRFDIANIKHEKKSGRLTTKYERALEKRSIIHKTKIASKNEFDSKLKELKKRLSELKSFKPSAQNRVLKKEKDLLEKAISNPLENYKSVVESNFFEIKHNFLWYNKEIRLYLIDSTFKDTLNLLINIYSSNSFKIIIYPYKLRVYTIEYSNEEIAEEKLYTSYIGTRLNELTNDTGLSIIKDINPFEEALDMYWHTSKLAERKLLTKAIFQILGYDVQDFVKDDNILKLSAMKLEIEKKTTNIGTFDNAKIAYDKNIYLLVHDKYSINEKVIKEIKATFRKAGIRKADLWTIGTPNKRPNNFLNKYMIKVFRNEELISLLLNSHRINLIVPILINGIKKKDNQKLLSIIAKKIKGSEILNSLDNLNMEVITWKHFQDFMESIFKFLFSESFKHYFAKPQAEEYNGIRKPDLVIHNLNPLVDFWKQRKSDQKAIRVIVDFKNYSDKIDGSTIDDIAKYLNKKRGNFAIIITKKGVDSNGLKRQKHLYFDHSKLIITINTIDIKEMISFKVNGQEPEEVLEKKIGELVF